MGSPTVPFFGKDSERLHRLGIAHKVLTQSGPLLDNWPSTVATLQTFKERIDLYQTTFEEARHHDSRWIAKRIDACNEAGITWQKIVNYLSAMEVDTSETLDLMGVTKPQRATATTPRDLFAPDLSIVNLDKEGGVRGSCSRERRRYTYLVEVTEGDPRIEEGWYHKASFLECTQMDMFGFQSGRKYSFRCKVIDRNNVEGPWSLVVTLMIT